MKLIIKDKNNNVLETYGILDCPVKDILVKDKCIELFNDNDPCIINISYARKKILLELEECLRKIDKENSLLIENIIKSIVETDNKVV